MAQGPAFAKKKFLLCSTESEFVRPFKALPQGWRRKRARTTTPSSGAGKRASICPGNWMSAGKRLSGESRTGNVFLKTALVTASIAAAKKQGSYF